MHPGRGPGLTERRLGEKGGVETVTLTESQMPQHTHSANVTLTPGASDDPTVDSYIGPGSTAASKVYLPQSGNPLNGDLAPATLPAFGGSQAHNNMQPYLTLNYIIALQGLYPSRS